MNGYVNYQLVGPEKLPWEVLSRCNSRNWVLGGNTSKEHVGKKWAPQKLFSVAMEKRDIRLREGVAERIPVQVFMLTETGEEQVPALCAVNAHLSEAGRSGEIG